MSITHLTRSRPVAAEWEGLSQEENDTKSAAIYNAVASNGGDMKYVAISPSGWNIVSVVEYPDDVSAKRGLAAVLALGTLEFDTVETLWDLTEWTGIQRAAQNG
jgi:uncharacterized protein with GYD domain